MVCQVYLDIWDLNKCFASILHLIQVIRCRQRKWPGDPGWLCGTSVQDGVHVGNLVSTLTLSQAAMHRLWQARQTLGASHEGESKCCCHPSQAIQSVHHKSAASPQPCGTTRWSVMVLFLQTVEEDASLNHKDGTRCRDHTIKSSSPAFSLHLLAPCLPLFFLPPSFTPFGKLVCFCLTPVHLLLSVFSPQFCDSFMKVTLTSSVFLWLGY